MSEEERRAGLTGDETGEPNSGDPADREADLTVRRSEEELRTGVRQRDAGAMNVQKNVRTEREEVRTPTRREEVDVERIPMEGESREVLDGAQGAFEEEEIIVQVFEEEVVVTKRVVLKEEIRIRKRVVEEVDVVEVDLRKEEVEIDDQTTRRGE